MNSEDKISCPERTEAQFHAVFNGAAIGIALVDPSGRPVQCNPALERFIGYSETELCSMTFPEFTHHDDARADTELYRSLLGGKQDHYQIEKRFIRKDGETVWGRLTVSLVRVNSAEPNFAVTMVEDITQHKRMEEALLRSETRLSRALEAAQMGTWEWNIGTSEVDWSDGMHFLFGLTPGDFEGTYDAFFQMVHPADKQQVCDEINEALANPDGKYHSEFRVRWPDGTIRWIEGRGDVVRDKMGKPLTMRGTVVDITTRKSAELALRSSDERLRATIENTPDVSIQWYDRDGRVLFWNKASEYIFGWKATEALGKKLDKLIFDAEQSKRFIEALRQVEATGKGMPPVEFPFHRKDGRTGVCLSTVFRIPVSDGSFCYVCMDVDLTQRKQAEQALQAAQERELRSREEFTRQLLRAEEQERKRLAAELHDGLGQNLSLVKNQCHMAVTQRGLPDTVKAQLHAISESTLVAIDEVRNLVRNLRPIQIEERGLTDSIRGLVDQVGQSTTIRLKSRIENVDDAFSGGSAMQVYRIVQEALNNLMKHSGAGRASLKLERDINCVRLQVTDNGTGFDPDKVLPRGGFGLKNIYERARMLGGWSRIQSMPGSGARLTVELPLGEGAHDEG